VSVRKAFDYAVLRAVPRVEREEFVNAGVILHAPAADFLAAHVELDDARVRALFGDFDVSALHHALEIHADRSPRCRDPSASTGWSRPAARSCRRRRCTRACVTIRRRRWIASSARSCGSDHARNRSGSSCRPKPVATIRRRRFAPSFAIQSKRPRSPIGTDAPSGARTSNVTRTPS
jgi:hypothetical protein